MQTPDRARQLRHVRLRGRAPRAARRAGAADAAAGDAAGHRAARAGARALRRLRAAHLAVHVDQHGRRGAGRAARRRARRPLRAPPRLDRGGPARGRRAACSRSRCRSPSRSSWPCASSRAARTSSRSRCCSRWPRPPARRRTAGRVMGLVGRGHHARRRDRRAAGRRDRTQRSAAPAPGRQRRGGGRRPAGALRAGRGGRRARRALRSRPSCGCCARTRCSARRSPTPSSTASRWASTPPPSRSTCRACTQLPAQRIGLLIAIFMLPFALLSYPFGRLAERHSRVAMVAGGSFVYGVGTLAGRLLSGGRAARADVLPRDRLGRDVRAVAGAGDGCGAARDPRLRAGRLQRRRLARLHRRTAGRAAWSARASPRRPAGRPATGRPSRRRASRRSCACWSRCRC